ncbi:uncharacterized protein isoform X1 [Salmo salar]|uniref:Uncharacterized protein isoform X1 n=1 Tax=Salmo salar TaxID=8030 RepID=A0ABM3EHX5_SALSA|nr:uncharacterized protein LOC123741626 isoform X1 [Salmo salar]
MFNLRGQIQKPGKFRATQLKQMDWRVIFVCAVAWHVSLVSQSYATGGVNTSLSTAQSNLSLCFTCNGERCQDVKKIFNSMRDDKIWTQSTATSALLGCSLTSSPFAGKCVPCVEDRKVYIVCLDMPKDLKLDLEDGDGNSFSYTEATCPRLTASRAVGHAGHNSNFSVCEFPSGVRGLAGHGGAMISIGMLAAAVIFVAYYRSQTKSSIV